MGYRNAVIEISIFSTVIMLPMLIVGIMAAFGVNYHLKDVKGDNISSNSTIPNTAFVLFIQEDIDDGKSSNVIGFICLIIDFISRVLQIYFMFYLKHNKQLISYMKIVAVTSIIGNLGHLVFFASAMTHYRDVEIQDQERTDTSINEIFKAAIRTERYDITVITFSIITGISAIVLMILVCFCKIKEKRRKLRNSQITANTPNN